MRSRPKTGFTLVELLTVIGVIVLLLGLLFPALRLLHTSGEKTRELSAARHLMNAYSGYANVNDDAVMPGYKLGLKAYDASHHLIGSIAPPPASARYPWRLAPFLDYDFLALYGNDQRELLEQMQETDYANYLYTASVSPSLGLNATWMGGNENELAFSATAENAFGRFYVTRLSQVRDPGTMIVFASARGIDPLNNASTAPVQGYFEVRSPVLAFASGPRWAETYSDSLDPGQFGFVSLRYDREAVVANADGHTTTLNESQLRDMRRWANEATASDWGLGAP